MRKQIRKIPIHAASKVTALVAFVISALFCIPIALFGLFFGEGDTSFFFGIPIFYLIFSYLCTAIYCWIYNLIAPHVGGIELVLDDAPVSKKELE
ncbi:hypothetical protein [Criblamydia sequanensis]|uniref:Membrane protein n=1 Tax=Candidatus Criblamydia sequanensis CRIB-18 TaxID=1437425 RepID=A0A090DZU7_9BACT|nr:hypothetical protein [Criblamydia sequanensis]CDR34144.1 putative membrane protein [Criblamydia sequanensis CRIB-18]